jgi:hypothetical protein
MRTPSVFKNDRDIEEMVAGADLSALEDTFLIGQAAGTVTGAGAGVVSIGVLRNAPAAAGVRALVQTRGQCYVNAEEALSAQDVLMVGAAGGAKIATSGNFPVAVALEDSLISTPCRVLLGGPTVLA